MERGNATGDNAPSRDIEGKNEDASVRKVEENLDNETNVTNVKTANLSQSIFRTFQMKYVHENAQNNFRLW